MTELTTIKNSDNTRTDGATAFSLSAADDRAMRQCIHCGLCLPACPTYRELGTEMDSPRGRLYLIRALTEGRLPLPGQDAAGDGVVRHLDLCLGCRACETACPSGVKYGQVLEGVRAKLFQHKSEQQGVLGRAIYHILMHRILPGRRLLAVLAAGLRLHHRIGLQRLAETVADRRLVPRAVANLIRKTPTPQGTPFHRSALDVYPAVGETRARVVFFTGCVMDAVHGDIHRDTIRVLTEQGVEVAVPKDQGCCGALHAHGGDHEFAVRMARENVEALKGETFQAFVNNSAGCGSHIRSWGTLLEGADLELSEAALRVGDSSVDVCRFLVDLGLRPFPSAVDADAAYDAPCHLVHAQKEADAPMAVLSAIPGLRVRPLPNADHCCGAAGLYTMTEPEMSARIFARKLEDVKAVNPSILVTGNPGCIIQFQQGFHAAGLDIEVLHPMQLAARTYV